MNTLIELLQGMPVIFTVMFFFATLGAIFYTISRDKNLRRAKRMDRRRTQQSPIYPFYDSDDKLVKEERRNIIDRRKRAIYIHQVQTRQSI